MRVLILSEHASLKFGGEAALPLHYFRVLRQRKIDVWMIVHERTKSELSKIFADDLDRIFFIKDSFLHKLLFFLGKPLPSRISYFTFGFLLRILTQVSQKKLAKSLIKKHQIDITHQPIPVSPKEPSMIYDMGVPVIIGPMNGGMNYPEGFKKRESSWINLFVGLGRNFSNFTNTIIPGKLKADLLLVANERTKNALPQCLENKQIIELVENGVDLSIWQQEIETNFHATKKDLQEIKIIYLGRLVSWKGVDLLLVAFKNLITILSEYKITLEIIGDGKEISSLEKQAQSLGLRIDNNDNSVSSKIVFQGQLSQKDCAQHLKSADMMVLPSLYECGGAVVLEAMAMKIPVIATNWGGPADYLDETCGILVSPDSQISFIDNITQAMKKLILDPDLRKSMGEMGYNKVISQFDWEKKVDRILEIYHNVRQKDESKLYYEQTN
ncbi:glycosyltransferase family 4 protein [Cyanobacterium sp. Dongsha4]|uniref:glycosyltransferase family 4 protein n=1 Tax=Cyanobacterium sp. DS4 TaxID=2878255 RepID=UPI002E81D691|nr:glycosyltransferase family 4 protein [Cyanobacterium sp. Dongsha4]WVL01109.1 glycosyltransferase family 4 protein [Cyanobacterium sp. Dongsha4]